MLVVRQSFQAAVGGRVEETYLALISAFYFDKAAELRRKCAFAYFCCYEQKYVLHRSMSGTG